nr:threonine--tRNA ligase [bacterium]
MNIFAKGNPVEVPEGATALDAARAISQGLARVALCATINGKECDLTHPLKEGDELVLHTFDSPQGKWALRHTASHILAQAVKHLFPGAKLAIGPAIEDGFYYDFDLERPLTPDDLEHIEAEMAKIIAADYPLVRFTESREAAIARMEAAGENYKVELIRDLPENVEISFYQQGDFTDLCAGPHALSTGRVKSFKLTQVAGAYWRGNEKNKMLQRVYGTAFEKKADLDAHLKALEEAKKRDHNRLGRELELFTTVDMIGQGLPILLPKGARVIQILQRFVEDEEEKRGFLLTKTPYMAKRDLYKISGHWDHYRDSMFIMGDPEAEGDVFGLRPMTCPFQFQAYLTRTRSYRDLPLRYNETSTLFRNESSGEMHGLIRLRQFTISEGHLACLPEQVEDEFKAILDLIGYLMHSIGLEDQLTYRFSKWDPNNREKYIGSPEEWERTQDLMRQILDHIGIQYTEAEGEAAFYGPKLDIQTKNVFGKEDTLITVQIDFQLAERFGMTYVDRDGTKRYPIIIHRTSIGCYERTLAMLVEKYAGAFPVWLSPEQVRIMTITERGNEWAHQVEAALRAEGIRTSCDLRNEKIGFKIREARGERVPYMLVIGDREAENGTVAVTRRGEGDLGAMALEDIVARIVSDVKTKKLD